MKVGHGPKNKVRKKKVIFEKDFVEDNEHHEDSIVDISISNTPFPIRNSHMRTRIR